MNPMTSAAISAFLGPLTVMPGTICAIIHTAIALSTQCSSSRNIVAPFRDYSARKIRARKLYQHRNRPRVRQGLPGQKINPRSRLASAAYGTLFNSTLKEDLPCQTPHSADPNSRSNFAPEAPRWACSSTPTAPPSPSNWLTADTTGCWSTRSTAPWATKNFPRCSAASPTAAPSRWSASADTPIVPASSRPSTWAPTASSSPTSIPPKKPAKPSVAPNIRRSARARSTSRSAA